MSALNEFISAQHSTNLHMAESLARIEQSLTDTNTRLFGGNGQQGILPYIVENAKAAGGASDERFQKIEARSSALESWKLGTLKWVAGVVAVLALEGTALGFYVEHVISKVPK